MVGGRSATLGGEQGRGVGLATAVLVAEVRRPDEVEDPGTEHRRADRLLGGVGPGRRRATGRRELEARAKAGAVARLQAGRRGQVAAGAEAADAEPVGRRRRARGRGARRARRRRGPARAPPGSSPGGRRRSRPRARRRRVSADDEAREEVVHPRVPHDEGAAVQVHGRPAGCSRGRRHGRARTAPDRAGSATCSGRGAGRSWPPRSGARGRSRTVSGALFCISQARSVGGSHARCSAPDRDRMGPGPRGPRQRVAAVSVSAWSAG